MLAQKQRWQARAQHKRNFDARLCHTKEVASPGDTRFVEAAFVDQPPKLALVAGGPFLFVVVDTHTVTIHPQDKSVKKIFRQRVARIHHSQVHGNSGIPYIFDDTSRFLLLLAHHGIHTVTLYGSAVKKGGTSSKSTNFHDSTALPHEVEYHRKLGRGKFLETTELSISGIIDEVKQPSHGLKFQVSWCGYAYKADKRKT